MNAQHTNLSKFYTTDPISNALLPYGYAPRSADFTKYLWQATSDGVDSMHCRCEGTNGVHPSDVAASWLRFARPQPMSFCSARSMYQRNDELLGSHAKVVAWR